MGQYAITKFGEALEVVPRLLAQNAGHDGNEMVAKLYAKQSEGKLMSGVDIETGETQDVDKTGLRDHLNVRLKGLELATNAATTVLRVDHIIMSKPAGGPKKPK